jgi:hypothetical protein
MLTQVAVELDESPRLKAQLHTVAAERDFLRYELQATVHKVLLRNHSLAAMTSEGSVGLSQSS